MTRLRLGSLLILPLVCVTSFLILAAAPSVRADDPRPPQISVNFIYPPSPLIQHGTPRLVYEMQVTNFSPQTFMLDSIDVSAGRKSFSFADHTLTPMMRLLGERSAAPAGRKIDGGRTAIVYLMLDFNDMAEVPAALGDTLHFKSPDGFMHALAVQPLEVNPRPPLVVAPPLRGSDWIAGDSVHNGPDAAHRRSIVLIGGQPFLAQRYAIDWVKYRMQNGVANTWSGPEDKNSSYFCYDAPIYSVAPGKVIEVLDGLNENVPHSGKMALDIDLHTVGGNHVVVDIGGGHYAFYAHARPGSITVKVDDQVTAGQVLGRVCNSGNSTEPHLHAHIVDRPSFLAGQGTTYAFDHFQRERRYRGCRHEERPDAVQECRGTQALHQRLPRHQCRRVLPLIATAPPP